MTLMITIHHQLETLEPFITDIFEVPGVTGVSWQDQPLVHVLAETPSELDPDALADFLGYSSYERFVESEQPVVVDDAEMLEQHPCRIGNFSSLMEITEDVE